MNQIIATISDVNSIESVNGVFTFALFSLLGVLALLGSYKLFDKLTPGELHGEIFRGNTAVAILAAGLLIAVSIILHAAIS